MSQVDISNVSRVMGGQTGAGLTNDIDHFTVSAGGTLGARQSFDTRGMGTYAGSVGGPVMLAGQCRGQRRVDS